MKRMKKPDLSAKELVRLLVFLLLVGPLAKQVSAQEEYTVRGVSRDALEAHIEAELGERQFDTMPRWHQAVCVDIHGIQDQFAGMLLDHLRMVGKELGLQVNQSCKGKRLFIFFTDQSDALASAIQKLNPTLFVGLDNNLGFRESKVTARRDEVREFLRPRAVRMADIFSHAEQG